MQRAPQPGEPAVSESSTLLRAWSGGDRARSKDVPARLEARKVQVVEIRFFGGLSVGETAEVLKVSAGTVMRAWSPPRRGSIAT